MMIIATCTCTPLLFGVVFSLSTNSVRRRDRYFYDISHGIMPHHVDALSMKENDGDFDASVESSISDSNERPSLPSQAELDILQLAQSHFASQALLAVMRLGVLDVLEFGGENPGMSADEIVTKLLCRRENIDATTINRDGLFRCLRLLCTTGVIEETTMENDDGVAESSFSLTEMGRLLRRRESNGASSMSSFVMHWAELPLWNAWSQLPDYIAGNINGYDNRPEGDDAAPNLPLDIGLPPFDRANNGMSASDYYKNNLDSCSHRNAVARYASSKEIASILDAMQNSSFLNESILDGKTIVDVGGGYGDLMYAVKRSMPTVGKFYCLDLQEVIDDALSMMGDDGGRDQIATLVPGNMFDQSTIPPCDLIMTKHVLCDFSDKDVVRALQSFRTALSKGGRVVIMDAVLPNGNELNGKWNAAVSFDVLLMLTGRRGERSRLEWSNLAEKSGFVLEDVLPTSSVTVDLAILSQA